MDNTEPKVGEIWLVKRLFSSFGTGTSAFHVTVRSIHSGIFGKKYLCEWEYESDFGYSGIRVDYLHRWNFLYKE